MKLNVKIHNPVSIREKVYSAIRSEIFKGRFPSGERIVETQLAKAIRTSRTPVREALHVLEREGLLEAIPRVGYRVKQIKWEEIEEICEIRAVNEILAARWAMERITAKELGALERNLEQADKDIQRGNLKGFVERDGEFHDILARASGSERLVELCHMLRRHMLRYRLESLYLPDTARRALRGHGHIVECIKRKDQKGVEKAIRDHLEFAKRSIQRYAFEGKKKK
jgi:GntR family transcriptional regulator, rspAB operon transcriptional repressor